MLTKWTVSQVQSAERDEASTVWQELKGEAEKASNVRGTQCAERDDASPETEQQQSEREIACAEQEEASTETVKLTVP
jgi:hypothetical protein